MIASIIWTLIGVGALIALNGLCVATEFALIGTRPSKLATLVRQGRRGAARLEHLLRDLPTLDRAIATIQVGITAASLGLGMYGEHALAELLLPLLEPLGEGAGIASHGLASVVAVALLTFFHIALGEVVPKSIALLDPPRAALLLYPILRALQISLRPFVAALALVGRGVLALLRLGAVHEAAHVLSRDEIETVIEEAGSGGALRPRHAEILVGLLEFEDLPVRKAMVPRNRVNGLQVNATRAEVLDTIRRSKHSRYPVYDRDLDDIIGYIHAKDLLRAQRAGDATLRDIARPVMTIPETAPATRLLRLFRRRRVHLAVVVDEHGGTAGIIMPDDLIEEIFGEVQDEFDAEEPGIHELAPTSARVRGDVRLDEVNEALGLELDEPYVDTIGGLVMARLGRLARPDDTLTVGAIRIRVERVSGRAVRSVTLTWS